MNSANFFDKQGFLPKHGLLTGNECDALSNCIDALHEDGPGTRTLLELPWCQILAAAIRSRLAPEALIPPGHIAVQCTLFEKSTDTNWLVSWHQDLSIPVRERVHHEALKGWSDKEGCLYVQPPAHVLESLVAVRVHVDDCLDEDGPLRVVPGSHTQGRMSQEQVSALNATDAEHLCTLKRGGALMMRPLLLHASSKASGSSRRRVLHFVFGPPALPCGLEWPANAANMSAPAKIV